VVARALVVVHVPWTVKDFMGGGEEGGGSQCFCCWFGKPNNVKCW
jgi:hypothetical protein